MTLPKPQGAPEVEIREILAQLNAEQDEWQRRADEVQGKAAQAYARLLDVAERSDTGQASRVAKFVASTFNGRAYPFDLFDLRAVDVSIGDDMLLCLDALRWAKADLYRLVPNGEKRIQSVVQIWNIKSAIDD